MFDKFFDGLCPECLLDDIEQDLLLNRGDVFECPHCHLMVVSGTFFRAVILRQRGSGDFRTTPSAIHATKHCTGMIMVRESTENSYEPDGFNTIDTPEALREYLNEITNLNSK